jgi:ribosomal silencing factor RsfS
MERICIYPKDIQIITGKSERQARNIMITIKSKLKKEKHQAVTIDEFCNYIGIPYEQIKKYIR